MLQKQYFLLFSRIFHVCCSIRPNYPSQETIVMKVSDIFYYTCRLEFFIRTKKKNKLVDFCEIFSISYTLKAKWASHL